MTRPKNPNTFSKLNIFKIQNRLKTLTASDELSCSNSENRLGLLKMSLSRKPTKNNEERKKPKLQTILRHQTVHGTIFIRFYLQEL